MCLCVFYSVLTTEISFDPYRSVVKQPGKIVINPILQMRTLSHREIK